MAVVKLAGSFSPSFYFLFLSFLLMSKIVQYLLLSKFQCGTSREDEPTASRGSHWLHAWAFEGYKLEDNNDVLSEIEGGGKAGGKEEIIGLYLLLPLP